MFQVLMSISIATHIGRVASFDACHVTPMCVAREMFMTHGCQGYDTL